MKKVSELIDSFKKDEYKVALLAILIYLVIFSFLFFRPEVGGESLLYTDSIEVIKTGIVPPGFIPNMVVSTYFGLLLIMLIDFFIGNIAVSWYLLDAILYVIMGLIFFVLLDKILRDKLVSFLGTILLVTNYSAVTFGLGYLMDMGGWTFYMASLYFSYKYLEDESASNKWIYLSSALVGLGGLYKEYAFVACIVIAGAVIWKTWGKWGQIFLLGLVTSSLALGPAILMNIYTYYAFDGYTYLDWFLYQGIYEYQNKPIEFIKSFGSIYNFGWFLFIPGFYILLGRSKEVLKNKDLLFIWLVILSCLCVLLWPVVTRVLFITMPAVVMVSCLFIKTIKNKWFITPLLILYIVSGFLMDSFVLNFINLPF